MANSYIPGKWSGTISADIRGDASKTTPTLGYDYDIELKNLKTAQSKVISTIKEINKNIKALKDHADTGKMASTYLNLTSTRLTKIQNELNSEVNTLSNAVDRARKEEWIRFKKILEQWEAAQKQGK